MSGKTSFGREWANQLCPMKILSGTEILQDAEVLHEGLKDDHCLLTSVVFLGHVFSHVFWFYLCVFLVKWVLLNFDIWNLHLYDMAAPQPPKQGRIWSLKLLVAQCDIPTSYKTRNQFRKDLVAIRNPYASLNKYLQFVPFRKCLGCKAGLFQMTCPGSCWDPTFRSICSQYSTTIMGLKLRANGSFYSGSRRFCQWIVIFPKTGWLKSWKGRSCVQNSKAEEARYADGFAWDQELRGTTDLSAWPNFTLSIASVKRKGTFCYENPEHLDLTPPPKKRLPWNSQRHQGVVKCGVYSKWQNRRVQPKS